ncbi:NAD-dependent protein deacetylase [Marinobacterium nitratireducens]|uniref:NAD-dependent protein deacetylase n=1 Tax=Marinobacterium nitratireducens TaxID=518897 RepID=A0A918DR22_9GAMM|nr:NAD-dependent protein deacetylase [Marinobacterium nitratireducens]GGO78222.1 NAD-dependent protein deacetylase [Marinobacterium nitratireducens]
MTDQQLQDLASRLQAFIDRHPRLLVLTGAGISTDSGIPDYRDRQGNWKRQPPVDHRDFVASLSSRQRFWARSLVGWPLMAAARPNGAHLALAALERQGHVEQLVTQNVDGLHERAGSRRVIDLHGRSDSVICLGCGARLERDPLQQRLARHNPAYCNHSADAAPDGDADLELDFSAFQVLDCEHCGGILKPDVVFFGDNVPRPRVEAALSALHRADALLVVGSSLMVYSGFRFCRIAATLNKPIAAINLGRTRADDLLSLKLEAPAAAVLDRLSQIA